jgi:selenium metabolism protein YedF
MEKKIYLNSDTLGNGSEELGKILIRNFLLTVLADETLKITSIFLANGAVKLACENSHVLDALSEFAAAGAKIYSCGTCLDYYGLKDKLKAGEPGNMKLLCSVLADENVHVIRP